MFARAGVIWFVLLLAAIANGAVREGALIPRTGEYWGHVISTVSLSALVLAITFMAIGWIAPLTSGDAVRIGLLWVAMTMAFEFLAGHYLFGNSWERLLADYNILQGRIWVLVLLTTFAAPVLARS